MAAPDSDITFTLEEVLVVFSLITRNYLEDVDLDADFKRIPSIKLQSLKKAVGKFLEKRNALVDGAIPDPPSQALDPFNPYDLFFSPIDEDEVDRALRKDLLFAARNIARTTWLVQTYLMQNVDMTLFARKFPFEKRRSDAIMAYSRGSMMADDLWREFAHINSEERIEEEDHVLKQQVEAGELRQEIADAILRKFQKEEREDLEDGPYSNRRAYPKW
jgi:ATP-dependent Lon protease